MAGAQLPIRGPAKAVQSQGMYDAEADAEDVWITRDDGSVIHLWYRAGKGWAAEELYKPN